MLPVIGENHRDPGGGGSQAEGGIRLTFHPVGMTEVGMTEAGMAARAQAQVAAADHQGRPKTV